MRPLVPSGVPAPFSTYSHGVEVTSPGRWLFGAGQVGVDVDGRVGDGIDEQTRLVWGHIVAILDEAEMGVENLVQINQFMTDRSFREPAGRIRAEVLGEHRPASTLLVVSGLASPEWLIEIDFTAVAEMDSAL